MRLSVGSSLAITAVLATLASCATLQRAVQKPSLRFKQASLAAISLGGATLDVVFDVQNPNPFGLSVAELDARFLVEGKQLVSTKPPLGIDLPARGTTELRLPMQIRFADVAGVAQAFLSKDQASYELTGNIGVDSPIGILRLPVGVKGQFDVPKMPQISLEAPRITNLSFTGATLELPIQITNPNALPLPIDLLKGSLRVQGSQLASVALDQIGSLGAGATKELIAPIRIDFSGAPAAADAIRRGRARLELSGQVSSGPASIPINVREELALVR